MTTANHVLLQRTTTTVNTSSITLSGIPASYTDLKIVISGRNNQSAYSDGFTLSVNSGSSYSTMELYQQNNGIGSYGPRTGSTYLFLGHLPGASSTANTFGNHEIYIANYTSTGIKTVSIDGTTENNGFQAYQVLYAGTITNGTAINSITINSLGYNFVAGSSFSLYGIANTATTPAAAPKADGGDIIKTDGTYWYHAFTGSGIFKPQVNLTCEVLVVAGGAGGGKYRGGGGGAGGLVYDAAFAATAPTVIAVGAGGAGAPGSGFQQGSNGSDSTFGSYTATGGGGGGGFQNSSQKNGLDGGSGGGAGQYSTSGTVGASIQNTYSGKGFGNAGGLADATTGAGGGGGGAGAVGTAANSSGVAGNGGIGKAYSSFASATGTGASGYYAGGGGGGGAGGANGSGGTGGGGAGGGISGTAASGGGGGGENRDVAGTGNGGSGIVIIKYPV